MTDVAFGVSIQPISDRDRIRVLVGALARVADAWGLGNAEAAALFDVPVGYPAGRALARALLAAGTPGVLYPSCRNPGGQCLAAFRPMLVQNIRHGATWRFTWAGSAGPVIEAVP